MNFRATRRPLLLRVASYLVPSTHNPPFRARKRAALKPWGYLGQIGHEETLVLVHEEK